MRFDHALIAVVDLDAATTDFEALGFRITYGGKHAGGLTHNSLITFKDASYLELIAPADPGLLQDPPEPGPGNYLFLFDAGEGYAGYALHTDELDRVVDRVRKRGVAIDDPGAGGRLREDGVELAWHTAFPLGSTSPFFITDDTPREHRVRTDPEIVSHPNGAMGIARGISLVANFDEGIGRYSSVLGAGPNEGPKIEGARSASFIIGAFEAVIAAPTEPGSSLAQHLDARGEGLYQIEIESSRPSDSGIFVSHGARIVIGGE